MTDLIGSAVEIVNYQVGSGRFGWLSRTAFADPMAREIVSRYLLVKLRSTAGEPFGFWKTGLGTVGKISKYANWQVWLCSILFVSDWTWFMVWLERTRGGTSI